MYPDSDVVLVAYSIADPVSLENVQERVIGVYTFCIEDIGVSKRNPLKRQILSHSGSLK